MSPILLDKAARILSAGGLIAYPTEAVYGLGCLPARQDTVERLLALKYRSWRKGLALVAADLEHLYQLDVCPKVTICLLNPTDTADEQESLDL